MPANTEAEIQHLVNLSGIAINMIRHPDFMRNLVECDQSDQGGIQTCLDILADTTIILMQRQGIKPRYRLKAGSRPHGQIPEPQGVSEDDQSDLFEMA